MKRLIKHNQLKPLSQMTPGSINGDIPEDGRKARDPSVATSKTKKIGDDSKDDDPNKKPKEPAWNMKESLDQNMPDEVYLKYGSKIDPKKGK